MWEGIAAGLIVAAIVAVISWLFRRQLLTRTRGVLIGLGSVSAEFKDATDAYVDIEKEALNSENICYVGSYNTTFLRERTLKQTLLYKILERGLREKEGSLPTVRFVHLHPKSHFVGVRAKELNYPAEGREIRDGIRGCHANIHLIEDMLNLTRATVDVRYVDFHLVLRLILLDKCAYVSHYKPGSMGKKTRVLKIRSNSEIFSWFQRYFDVLWDYVATDNPDEEPSSMHNRSLEHDSGIAAEDGD